MRRTMKMNKSNSKKNSRKSKSLKRTILKFVLIALSATAAENESASLALKQLPKLKEEDTRLFIFAASGFSSTTISTILEKDKGIVYNRIWRLKSKIASSDAHDKEDFLAILNA